ncbi:hypothetical protein LCGC14_1933930 [marine sediment metagenome]|uniref:Uncharacterized protein n=1 Tax=marine sediment metagenome TaxID=412755 RepID=A0A0F9IJT3_9ZZZZ
MQIKIKLEDIRKAKEETRKWKNREVWQYSRAETCPLAFALNRIYNKGIKLVQIRVQTKCIYIDNRRIELPKAIQKVIEEIDRKHDRIRPRELEIDLDAPTAKTTT